MRLRRDPSRVERSVGFTEVAWMRHDHNAGCRFRVGSLGRPQHLRARRTP